jgi:hypothetical protein
MELAKAAAAQLTDSGIPSVIAVEDLTKCNGKKPCLIDLGRKQKVTAMVFIEVGTVLDEAFARAEAVSIEEDGKSLGVAEAEGRLEALTEGLKARVAVSLVPPLRTLLGLATPVVAVKEVTVAPVMVEAPPVPAPEKPVAVVVAVEPVPSKPFFTTTRVIGTVIAGLGVGTLVTSGIFGGSAAAAAGQQTSLCPAGQPCTNPAAFAAYNSAASAQNTSLVLLGVGAGLAAVGVVVMLLPSGEATTVSMTPVPGGAAAVVSGSF